MSECYIWTKVRERVYQRREREREKKKRDATEKGGIDFILRSRRRKNPFMVQDEREERSST